MATKFDFLSLVTEERNPSTKNLDQLNTLDLVSTIQAQDFMVADAVKTALPEISIVVDECVKSIKNGGRIFYFGAGTSGRIGLLDAAECPPTFGVDENLIQAFLAGGKEAMFRAVEAAEDDFSLGQSDITKAQVSKGDVVIGIASSGRTPYVIGAVQKANEIGAVTVALVNNKDSELSKITHHTICACVGSEALTGSTRMKSASSQKMILNILSTATMVKLGKVYENLMIDLKPTNSKLKERAIAIISLIANVSRHDAEGAFVASHHCVKTAIVMLKKKLNYKQASEILDDNDGILRKVIG